jgi:hypothetical protein
LDEALSIGPDRAASAHRDAPLGNVEAMAS